GGCSCRRGRGACRPPGWTGRLWKVAGGGARGPPYTGKDVASTGYRRSGVSGEERVERLADVGGEGLPLDVVPAGDLLAVAHDLGGGAEAVAAVDLGRDGAAELVRGDPLEPGRLEGLAEGLADV